MFTEKSTDVKCIAHTKNEKTMFHIKKKTNTKLHLFENNWISSLKNATRTYRECIRMSSLLQTAYSTIFSKKNS